MSSNAIPASKRRRLNEVSSASSTLSKPFKSPLRRPQTTDPTDNETHPNNSSISTPKPSSKHTASDTASASATITTPTPQIATPLRSSKRRTPATPTSSYPNSPLITSLHKQQSSLQSRLSALRQELDTTSQALKIETSGKDTELEALVVRWRSVSREAAEELFVSAKERVNRMGGVGAWKEKVKNSQMSRYDYDGGGEENRKNGEEELGSEYDRMREEVEGEEYRKTDGVEEEDDEDEGFTMDMMLKNMNIELDVIGFDKADQRWID